MHNIQMDYLKQFWEAYPENRKFFRTHFSEAHELTGELVQYMDDDLANLLQYFMDKGYLEDTMITLVSDHGAHALTLRFPAIPDNSRYIENYYPILFHVTKNDIPETNGFFMEANEQAFISSHDVFSFLGSIASNKKLTSDFAASYPYQMQAMPKGHDCSNSTVYIADCW
jgi:arylsulfatase A-like enzyme